MKKFAAFILFMLFASSAQATTYFVGQGVGDSDANSCTTAQKDADGSRKRNIMGANGGLACLALTTGGDVLDIRAGTYAEQIDSITQTIPAGTSFTNPVTIRGHAGEVVIVRSAIMNASNIQYIIFDNLIFDGNSTVETPVYGANGATHVRVQNSEVKNCGNICVQMAAANGPRSCCWEFINVNIHDGGKFGVAHGGYGLYIETDHHLFERLSVHDNPGFGMHMYFTPGNTGVDANILRYSKFYNNGGSEGSQFGVLISSGTGNQAYKNIIYQNTAPLNIGSGCINCVADNNTIWSNNVIRGSLIASNDWNAVVVAATASGTTIRNNIFWQNFADSILNQGTNPITSSSNLSTDPSFVNSAGGDFNLSSTSTTAIDNGTNVGIAFNGTKPDIGAYESWTRVAEEIGTVNASTITINFQSANAPILPLTGCTGWSARVNAVARSLTSCSRSGNAQYQLVMSSAAISTDTVDYSYAVTGSMTDSVFIGGSIGTVGTSNQRLNAITNQAVVNNIAGGSGFVLTVKHKRVRNYMKAVSDNTAQAWLWPEDVDGTVRNDGGKIAIANMFDCTVANCPAVGWRYEFNVNNGVYSNVTNSCVPNPICFDSTDSLQNHGAQITAKRLTCAVTFVTGGVIAQDSSFPVIALNTSQCTETQGEFAVLAGLANGTQICVRPKPDSGITITHTVTACFTVVSPAATPA